MKKNKGGFLSPKAINNRIKSKGLQKLRWYCQMCQKQCKDAVSFFHLFFYFIKSCFLQNGFKCHFQSESYQRQLVLAGGNQGVFFNFLYLGHNTNTTHLTHPLNDDNLPTYWKIVTSSKFGTYYVNYFDKTIQYDHPLMPKQTSLKVN